MLGVIIIICFTILIGETMYFNHKEKIEKMKLEGNPLNKMFSGNKNKED